MKFSEIDRYDMKLSDILANVEPESDRVFNNVPCEFFSQLDIDDYDYDYDKQESEGRFLIYPINTWMCTDTEVGHYMVKFDGQPVAYCYQSARKNYYNIYWTSKEEAKKVKEYLKQFEGEDPSKDNIWEIGDMTLFEMIYPDRNSHLMPLKLSEDGTKVVEDLEKLHKNMCIDDKKSEYYGWEYEPFIADLKKIGYFVEEEEDD